MIQKFRRTLGIAMAALGTLAATAAPAGQPQLTMTYELTGERGKVVGTLTAPLTDTSQNPLPEDVKLDITVTRSAYSLGQNDLTVARYAAMAPGETVTFADDILPEWQLNQDYTYRADVTAQGYSFLPGYSGMNPGIDFVFEKGAFTLTPGQDGTSVDIRVEAPCKMTSGALLEEPMTALEVYRAVDTSAWPYRYEVIYSEPNPEPLAVVTFTDTHPKPDTNNYYIARAVTQYGFAEVYGQCYVGFDIPAGPYPVTAEATADGVLVSWTAPDRGQNWGVIDPADLWYNVYRCRGYGAVNRELIATRISETSYVDTGADLTEPLQVRYEVEAGNAKGAGGSNYSSYDYDVVVGPAYELPFRDTFDGGFTKVWTLEHTDYWANWYEATVGEYGDRPVVQVRPVQGSGLVYVDYVYNSPASGATNRMTSYKLDLKGMENPWVSFWYYAIPDNDVTINFAASEDPANFGAGETIRIAEGTEKAAWKKVWLPMTEVAGSEAGYVRFSTSFLDVPSSAMLDDVAVMNYPLAAALEAVADEEAMTATLTWQLDEGGAAPCQGFIGYVDGEEYGEVSSPWVYDGLVLDRSYTFGVRPVYEGVEVAASEIEVMIKTPAPTAFTVGDYDYGVLDTEVMPKQVHITRYHGRGGILRLPAQVTYADETYSVVGIGIKAFSGNSDVESVTIPEGYTVVMGYAFTDNDALYSVSFPASLLTIGAGAFSYCRDLSMVNFAGDVPPTVASDAFKGIAEGCKGRCPESAVEVYVKTEGLEGIDFGYKDPSGIRELLMRDDVTVEWYDMMGRPVGGPVKGEPRIVRVTLPDGSVRVGKSL